MGSWFTENTVSVQRVRYDGLKNIYASVYGLMTSFAKQTALDQTAWYLDMLQDASLFFLNRAFQMTAFKVGRCCGLDRLLEPLA